MALDQSYFDAIHIDVVRKKYYNANKVEALLADIRRQALALERENETLRTQLAQLSGRKDEIGDTLLSAKSIAQQILQEAQVQADGIVAAAEARRRELEAEDAAGRRETVRQVENCYSRLREMLLGCVDSLNADFQSYLCALDEKVGAIAREIFALDGEDELTTESFEA